MLLAYPEIVDLLNRGIVENTSLAAVNAASLDVRLGYSFKYERCPTKPGTDDVVDLEMRDSVAWQDIELLAGEFICLNPGDFILACTLEKFYLPNDISAQFLLKSSIARNGLDHLAATWCDAGWNDSVLTLELRNVTRHHRLLLRPGMFLGQMKFYQHTEVPEEQSYATRGRYNGDSTGAKGIKP